MRTNVVYALCKWENKPFFCVRLFIKRKKQFWCITLLALALREANLPLVAVAIIIFAVSSLVSIHIKKTTAFLIKNSRNAILAFFEVAKNWNPDFHFTLFFLFLDSYISFRLLSPYP